MPSLARIPSGLGPTCLLSLPSEVLEQVYLVLPIPDRLRLLRTCKFLQGIYQDSSVLAYDFSLSTLAYLDVPRRPAPPFLDHANGEDGDHHTRKGKTKAEEPPPPPDSPNGADGNPFELHFGGLELPQNPFQRLLDDHDDFHHSHEHRLRGIAKPTGRYTDPFVERNHREPMRGFKSSIYDRPEGKDMDSVVARNRRLVAREKRWEELDPRIAVARIVKGPAGVYELQEGIFLLCDHYMGPAGPGTGKPTSIRLFKLPSGDPLSDAPIGPTIGDRWQGNPVVVAYLQRLEMFGNVKHREEMPYESHSLGFSIADLTMDPTQDLIVVSEHNPCAHFEGAPPPPHRLHLLSMSTFKPHPLASAPTLDFPPFAQVVGNTRQLLQVMGDILIVMVSRYTPLWLGTVLPHIPGMESEEEIVVWNWKTGNVLSRMALPENGWFSSLALLTPTTFMITSTSSISPVMSGTNMEPRSIASIFPPVIQIYSFLPDPETQAFPLQPLSTEHTDDSTARPVLLAQLELPRFSENIIVSSFDVRPDPAFPPPSTTDEGQAYPGCVPTPFTQDPSRGVLVFELHLNEAPAQDLLNPRNWPRHSYELFMLRETLITYAEEGEERLRDSRKEAIAMGWGNRRVEVIVPWTKWGVEGARLMDISMKRRAWVCSCSGYRFASLVRDLFRSRDPDDIEDPEDDDDDDMFGMRRTPHINDIRMLDFSPVSVRKEQSRVRAVLGGEKELQLQLPPSYARDFVNALAKDGYYDDARGFRITEKSNTTGPTYEVWRIISPKVYKRVINTPTTLSRRRVFQEDVESRLAYVDTVRVEGVWSNGIMMDDQRIMVVSTEEFGGSPPRVDQKMTILCM